MTHAVVRATSQIRAARCSYVEQLQGTILREHWRTAFRRRYFRKRFQLQASLDGLLQFCDFERHHQAGVRQ